VIALTVVAFATVGSAAASHPMGKQCGSSWVAAVDGQWSDAANWTNGVPAEPTTACITKRGTYTVHIPGGALPGALTLGGTSGTQTLSIEGNCTRDAVLDIGESVSPDPVSTIGTNGVLRLTDTSCGGGATLEQDRGTIINSGTIAIDAAGVVTSRRVWAHIDNYGTLRLGAGSETTMNIGIDEMPSSITEVHLGAAGGGRIVDSEPAIRLDGTLAIVADPGYVPIDGYHFSACTNCPGRFAAITGQTLANGFFVHRHYHVAPDGYPTVELKVRKLT
jgi:hypothetical protein